MESQRTFYWKDGTGGWGKVALATSPVPSANLRGRIYRPQPDCIQFLPGWSRCGPVLPRWGCDDP